MNVQQEIARLTAENEALKAKAVKRNTISLKVSEKGGLSVYGLGRFPVTLYMGQWERLIGFKDGEGEVDRIRDFIQANLSKFATKD